MRTLGRHLSRRSRPHFPQACPFSHYRGRRRGLAILAGAPPLPSVSSGVDNPPRRARQVQLVWNASSQQPRWSPHVGSGAPQHTPQQLQDAATAAPAAAPSQLDYAAAVELMGRIKAARSWQQLQALVDENLPSMNHLHISAVVTHMAQLHASSSSINSNGGSSNGTRRSNGGVASDDFCAGSRLDDLWQHLEDGDVAADASQQHRNQRQQATPADAGPFRLSKDGSRHLRNEARQPAESSRRLVAQEEHQLRQPGGALPLPLHMASHAADSRPSVPSHHQDTQAGALQQSLQLPRSQHLQQYRNTDPRVIFLQRLEHAVVAHLPHFEGRQLANTLWAMAKLGHRPSEKWLEVMLTRASSQLHTFNPQHLANTLYALMLLRYMPPPAWLEDFYSAVGRRLHGFGPGELSHLCYAAGKLGLQPGRELLGGVLHHSLMHMQAYGVRELALLAYGVVHMGARLHADWLRVYRKRVTGLVIESGALPARFLERLAEQLGQQQQLDLAELARAQLKMRQQQLSQQQYPPGQHQQYHIHHTTSEQHHEQQHQQELGLMEHGSSHVWPSVTRGDGLSGGTGPGAASTSSTNPESLLPPSFSSSPVDNSIDSIMATTISVATVAPAAAWAPVSASPRAARVASYLPTVLCSLAEVGYRPPSIFLSTVLAAVGSCAGQLTPVGLTTVLLSLANMRYRPHPALFWRVWSLLMNSLESLETQQCTVAIWASAILGCDAPRGDVAAILANAAARLPDHSDRELLQLLEAVSALGFEPTTSWLELLESDLYNRLPRMEPPQVAALLLPLAGLGHKPHRLWMARWAEAMAAGLPELGLRHMAAAAYGAARLGFRPPSRLCGELLAATAAELGSTATAAVEATAAQQQQQQDGGKQQQLSRLGGRQGDEPKLPHRARSAWERRHGDRAHSSRHLPETLSRLLWALAVLDIRPDAGWLSSYMECLGFMREDLSSQERVKVVWALARFRYNPGPEWAQDLALWRDEARLQQQQEGLLPHSGRGSIGAGEPAAPVMALDTRGNDVGAAAAATAEAAALRRHDNGVRDSSAAAAAIAGSAAATHVALTIDNLTAGTAGAVSEVGTANLADTQAPMVHCVDHDSSSKSSISKSNGGSSLDVNTFVLQGIHEWASRQLSDPESSARPRRGRRRLVRGVR